MNSPAIKLRLMCSNGGHILPRPHDKTLCYVGGETHIITMDRHTTLSNLTNRISKTLIKSSSSACPTTSFLIKYQLPTEDLDSLITITNDEDLENMIDEYEKLDSGNNKRIRLFVFPTDPVSVSSNGSDLENFKSGDWFLNALNGTSSGFSDTSSSVNCLLGLDDEKKGGNYRTAIDVNSMETTSSSFGSGTSIGQLKGVGIEEQFAQSVTSSAPVVVSSSPVSSTTANLENSDPFFFFHDRPEQSFLKQQQFQQKQSSGFDFASPDSVLSDFTTTDQLSPVAPVVQVQSASNNVRAAELNDSSDQNTRKQIQQQQIQNSTYLLSMPTTQIDTQRPQLLQQQMQYMQPLQYIPHHHHHPSGAVPVSSYYQQYPHQPLTNQQNFVYYMPARQTPQGYNYPLEQPQPSDAQSATAIPNNQSAQKGEYMAGAYRTTNTGGPQLVQVLSGRQNQNQYVGYSEIHHPSQPQYSQDR